MATILSIDSGTSGTKAIVVDGLDRILAVVEEPLTPAYLPDGGVEQDPVALWETIEHTATAAYQQAGVPIDAIALTNQGESVLAWDPATGEPLTPIIVWQDSRSGAICERVRVEHAEAPSVISERTGLVLDPYFTAPKVQWLRENVTREGIITTTDTWILYKLTGRIATDPTTASRSLVLPLDTLEWDQELLSLFNLEGEQLPEILPCDSIVGTSTILGDPVPVAGIIVDQQAALLAQSCLKAGQSKCTFGTGAFLLANVGSEPQVSTSGLACSLAWKSERELAYCFDGQIYTAASAVRWLQELGLIEHASQMDALATSEHTGVYCVPAFAGLAAPWWDSQAKASFTGLSLSSGRGELVAALLRGIAAQVALLLQLVSKESGVQPTSLQVDGGLTRSRFLMQAVADLAQVTVQIYPSPHATALGAVALARMALEPGLEMEDALVAWEPQETFEPQYSPAQARQYCEEWLEAAGLKFEDFVSLQEEGM